mmetsp:Transcript_11048/g.27018  ORF Transcript_11048/g.27018 Transcript_11048/m.27018 type:complete len:307 (+) Transcript_11048:228-1148(+)
MDALSQLLAAQSLNFEEACARVVARDQARINAAKTVDEKLRLQLQCGQLTRPQVEAEAKKRRKIDNGSSSSSSSGAQIQPVVVQFDPLGSGDNQQQPSTGNSGSSSSSSARRSLPFKTASSSRADSDWLVEEVRTSQSSMPHLIRLVNAAKTKKVNTKQNSELLAVAGDPKRIGDAIKKVTLRPGSQTEDCRANAKAYIRCMLKLGERTDVYRKPFPLTRQKAVAFFAALCGDSKGKSIYLPADDYLWTTIARLRAIPGAYDLKQEDRTYISQIVNRQKRAGVLVFQHAQARAVLLEEIASTTTRC